MLLPYGMCRRVAPLIFAIPRPPLRLSHFALQVRQTAISWDGAIVLASCEDGTIWRWDRASLQPKDDGSEDVRDAIDRD